MLSWHVLRFTQWDINIAAFDDFSLQIVLVPCLRPALAIRGDVDSVRPGEDGGGRHKLAVPHLGPPEVRTSSWLMIPDLRKKNDHKHDGQGPGGQKPDYWKLPLDGGVVPDHGEHMESLNGHPEDREETRDYCHNKQTVEKLEVVTGPVRHGGHQANHPVQEEGEGEEGRGDDVRVWEEGGRRMGKELLDEDEEGDNTGQEADAADDDVEVAQSNWHHEVWERYFPTLNYPGSDGKDHGRIMLVAVV